MCERSQGFVRGQFEYARGDPHAVILSAHAVIPTPLRSRGSLAARSFVYDGGSEKSLTIYWAAPNRLTFLLCPHTPDLAFCVSEN
jgi:hypothetical protein